MTPIYHSLFRLKVRTLSPSLDLLISEFPIPFANPESRSVAQSRCLAQAVSREDAKLCVPTASCNRQVKVAGTHAPSSTSVVSLTVSTTQISKRSRYAREEDTRLDHSHPGIRASPVFITCSAFTKHAPPSQERALGNHHCRGG